MDSVVDGGLDTRLSLAVGCCPPRRRPVLLFGEVLPSPEKKVAAAAVVAAGKRGREQRGEAEAEATTTRQRRSCKKGRRGRGDDDDDDGDRRSPSGGGGDEEGASRKKLRLTGEQATLLEDSFRAHNILSHAEKQELAGKLGLSARQVEVWFQNRRARTKLKQTEADCDLLRRWCDHLAADNARLRRDLAELRRSSSSPPVSGLAVATPVVCPSCAHDDKRRLAFATAAAAAGDMASN
ncbi:hypothetical protein OsI_05862 [Oryza sativa Indica Group]|nr:hypothetical protein OsI_05862 [Oryza sativa Indica Group]EAZ21752.1 hypothetical protein OsJ_05387 [Oryza sativa Japonica Group]